MEFLNLLIPTDFQLQDLATIGLLVFLEGILSVDNALAIALIARSLPKSQQRKALTYGLVGAVAFRIVALAMVQQLMGWVWVKFIGGGYLMFIAIKHWVKPAVAHDETKPAKASALNFWKVILLIELTDIAFAADSILAAVAVSNKLWVIVIGGIIGLIAMRFAASHFIKLLEKFPNFEQTAYLLVFGVGIKLIVDGFKFPGVNFHSGSSPAFWIFWLFVAVAIAYGFMKRSKAGIKEDVTALRAQEKAIKDIENF